MPLTLEQVLGAPAAGLGSNAGKDDEGEGKGKGKNEGTDDTPVQKKRKTLTSEQLAAQTKTKYNDAIAKGTSFLLTVQSSPHWAHFNHDHALAGLRGALQDLQEAVTKDASGFFSDYIFNGPQATMKKLGKEAFANKCVTFSTTLNELILKVARETSALVVQKAARDRELSGSKEKL